MRALGDLSGFPALCNLSFKYCEVMFCSSVLGAVRHASLVSLCFALAHPAPECEPRVLQLSQALGRLRPGGVLNIVNTDHLHKLEAAQGQAPFSKFIAAVEAYGL